jgi:hypothetical protein
MSAGHWPAGIAAPDCGAMSPAAGDKPVTFEIYNAIHDSQEEA